MRIVKELMEILPNEVCDTLMVVPEYRIVNPLCLNSNSTTNMSLEQTTNHPEDTAFNIQRERPLS